jgi:RNA polymerase sigma factor (sigma-70 family)
LSREDIAWVKRVNDGDHSAYRYLIRAYEKMAFAIAVSVIKDSQIAQEIVQDAFLKAYQRLHLFNMQSSFKTWFYRIVTNEALMRCRKTKRDNLLFVDVPDTITDDSFLEEITSEALTKHIDEALHQLPSKESLVLRLFYLQEMDIKAVAEVTGWSVNNVKVILHRSRKRMKLVLLEILKKENDEN